MTVYVGQDVRVELVAIKPDGDPADAASVRFMVKNPVGAVTTYALGPDPEVTEDTEGLLYALTFDAEYAGRYVIRAEALDGTSAVMGVDELTIICTPSKVV